MDAILEYFDPNSNKVYNSHDRKIEIYLIYFSCLTLFQERGLIFCYRQMKRIRNWFY